MWNQELSDYTWIETATLVLRQAARLTCHWKPDEASHMSVQLLPAAQSTHLQQPHERYRYVRKASMQTSP